MLEVPANGGSMWPDDWSRDGRFIIGNISGKTIFALPMTGDRKPRTLFQSQYSLDEPHFSPDGRWVAYSTTESGQTEIYVSSFPEFKNIRQVSSGGGLQPRWRGDGKELFYLTQEGELMSVDVRNAGAALEPTSPKPLFETHVISPAADFYAPSSDGQKFLVLQPAEQTTVPPITVVVNWLAGLNKN